MFPRLAVIGKPQVLAKVRRQNMSRRGRKRRASDAAIGAPSVRARIRQREPLVHFPQPSTDALGRCSAHTLLQLNCLCCCCIYFVVGVSVASNFCHVHSYCVVCSFVFVLIHGRHAKCIGACSLLSGAWLRQCRVYRSATAHTSAQIQTQTTRCL